MINIEDFLHPITEANECGEDLHYSYIYDQIREHRREEDSDVSVGVWQRELKRANWPEVTKICTDLLLHKTKDLQIAMWLLEAMTVNDGLPGMHDSVRLIVALCEKFWDSIYPSIDWENKSYIHRLSPFYFFTEKIQDHILMIPLTDVTDIHLNYNLSDWITARHNFKIKNNKGISLNQINKSVISTSTDFFLAINNTISPLLSSVKSLDKFITEKCAYDAPSFRVIISLLEDIKLTNESNLSTKQALDEIEYKKKEARNNPQEPADCHEDVNPTNTAPSIEQAYTTLGEISTFLAQQQPQSPASTLVKIASIIGKKTFQELLGMYMDNGATVMGTISELQRILSSTENRKK